MKHFSNLMQRFLLVMLALCASVSVDAYDFEAAHFSKSWPFVNECSLQQEEESGYCGNPEVNEGKNLCYVVTSVNDVKTLTIFRNPNAVGDDFGIAEGFFRSWAFSVLVIEDGVTSIGQAAFIFCDKLTTATFPEGLTSIGKSAFWGCESLTTVNFPEGLTSIGESAFRDCSSLTTVTFPEGLASIGQDAFYGCSSLTTLTFPEGLTSIGQYAFDSCSSLTTVTFPEGLTSIGESAFRDCSSLTTVTFPEGLASIGQYAFADCSSLTTLTFPDGLASIGQNAFDSCSSLTTLTFPSSLTSIGNDAFAGCWGLKTVTFPEGLTSIGQGAFMGCISLTTLTFPDGLTSIGQAAFMYCENLTTLTFPSSLTSIGEGAFGACWGVTDIYCHAVPSKLTWIDEGCDDFMADKATRCHVYDEGDWSAFEGVVNVTFVGDLPVVLEKNGDNSDLVAFPPTKAKDVTLADRVLFADGSWNTLCLPFSLSSLDGTPLEGFTVKELDTQTAVDGHTTGLENDVLYLNFKDATSIEAGKPYIVKKKADLFISSEEEWETFAENVSDGESYTDQVVMLGADISVKTMAGTDEKPFCGTFDGNGHTISVSIKGEGEGLALFYIIEDATIQNVKVTGTVTSSFHRPATFAAIVEKSCTIRNCWSSVDIVSTRHNGWIDGGAFVARVSAGATLNMQDCAFTGTVTYNDEAFSGGSMVGFTQKSTKEAIPNPTANLTNCLYFPTDLKLKVIRFDPHIFVSGDVRGNLTNCYYNAVAKKSILENEGIDASDKSTEELATALGDKWEVSGDNVLPKFISDIKNPVFHAVTICKVDPADMKVVSEDSHVQFIGTFSPVNLSTAEQACLYLDSNNTLNYPDDGTIIGSLYAYFQTDRSASLLGDVNGDGEIDISDVVKLVNIILGDGTEENSSADVNGDGEIDISDVVRLVNIILGDDSSSSSKIKNVVTNVGIGY